MLRLAAEPEATSGIGEQVSCDEWRSHSRLRGARGLIRERIIAPEDGAPKKDERTLGPVRSVSGVI